MRVLRTSREKTRLLRSATQGQRAESCSSRRALHCWRSMHLSSWQACALTSSIINCIKYIFWIRDGGAFPGEWPLTSPGAVFLLRAFGKCKQRERPRWGTRFKGKPVGVYVYGPALFLQCVCYVTEVLGWGRWMSERGIASSYQRKDREKCNHYFPVRRHFWKYISTRMFGEVEINLGSIEKTASRVEKVLWLKMHLPVRQQTLKLLWPLSCPHEPVPFVELFLKHQRTFSGVSD